MEFKAEGLVALFAAIAFISVIGLGLWKFLELISFQYQQPQGCGQLISTEVLMNIKKAMRKLRREGIPPMIAMNLRKHMSFYHHHPRHERTQLV